jgi:deoxyribose-phosphate aldolase
VGKLGKDMIYLQKIVLQGRWGVVEQYINEVKSDLGPDVIIKV